LKPLALLLTLVFAQAGTGPPPDVAQLFDRALTFDQFMARATLQRELWVKNASQRDIPAEAVGRLTRVRDGLRFLIVAEDWCPDSVYTVPFIANLAAAAGVDVRIIDRAGGQSLMAQHRTRDGRPVTPTVVLLRGDRDVGAWVERPAPVQEWFFSMATDPESARRFAERASWYEADRGRTTIAEVLALAERTAAR
jgi:thioredoxin family protein